MISKFISCLVISVVLMTTNVLAQSQVTPTNPNGNDSTPVPGIPGTSITRPVVDIKCDKSYFDNKDYMTASDVCLTAANQYDDISRELEAMDSLDNKSYWISFIKYNEAYCFYQTAYSLKQLDAIVNKDKAHDNAVLAYNLIKEYHDALIASDKTDEVVSKNDIDLGNEYIDLIKLLLANFPEVFLNAQTDFNAPSH